MLIGRAAPETPPYGEDIYLPLNTLPSRLYFRDHLQGLPIKQRRLWRIVVNKYIFFCPTNKKSFNGSELQKENSLCA